MWIPVARNAILLILLLVFPITSIYPHVSVERSRAHDELNLSEFTEDLSYDQLLKLFDAIEDGRVETCSALEQAKIAHFITYLAKQGMLSTEDNSSLEEDIAILLDGQENIFAGAVFQKCGRKINCLPGKEYKKIVPTYHANWFSKRWRYIKNFAKKHKKALIIGAAVVVAGAIVITILASSSTAAIAGAATAAAVDEKISDAKEQAAADGLFEASTVEPLPDSENARALGSLFAHEALEQLPQETGKSLAEKNHFEVDQSFGVNYAHLSNFDSADFTLLSYQMRGEHALFCGYLDQAVEDFGKVITLNPQYSLAYLERGMAHFELGNYQNSLNDYHQFTKHRESFSIPEFSKGFAKGLPQGIYDSGTGMFLFISEIVTHPVNTSTEMWHSLGELKKMVSSKEWALLGEVLVPEVYQLVKEWDSLSSQKRGELAGYALGKHGSDILLPGATVKMASSGMKYSKEFYSVLKKLQNVEHTLVLESVANLGTGAVVAETVQNSRSILLLGEEMGLSVQELGHLKQTGTLETAVAQKAKYVFEDPVLKQSFEFYKKAESFLEKYNKVPLPENRVRELIHQTGIKTFPRPKGIPETYSVRITDKGGGMEFIRPNSQKTSIRVMPGKPHSPYPYQQKPYVVLTKQGQRYDNFGNIVDKKAPSGHIPLEEFIYIE